MVYGYCFSVFSLWSLRYFRYELCYCSIYIDNCFFLLPVEVEKREDECDA